MTTRGANEYSSSSGMCLVGSITYLLSLSWIFWETCFSSLAIWSSFSQELPPGSRMLTIKIHSSYKYKDITITKTIMVRHNGQFCSNSVKQLLTNCWKLAGLGVNNRSAKNKNFFILVWHETRKVFYELEKGSWMFSKQTTLHGIDFLETHDSNFADKLWETCQWRSAHKSLNNYKYAQTRQGHLLPNSEIDQNQKTTLKANQ